MSKSCRLFVAVYPPPGHVELMLGALRRVELPDHRKVPQDQVHLTLHFIGDTPAGRVDETVETVERATGGLDAFELTPQRLTTLPQRGAARLVAAEADRPATLIELHRRLVTRLARETRRRPSDRFLPHFTLCRFRTPSKVKGVDVTLECDAFRVERLVVMRSTLRPDGARHEAVAEIVLTRR